MNRILLYSTIAVLCGGCGQAQVDSSSSLAKQQALQSDRQGEPVSSSDAAKKESPAKNEVPPASAIPSRPSKDDIGTIAEETERIFKSLTDKYREDVDSHDMLGRFLFFTGEYEAARQAWMKGLEISASDPYCLTGMGLVYQATGDHELAEQVLRQAQKGKPSEKKIQLALAKAMQKQGKFGEAVTLVQESLKAHSDSSEAWELLGQLHLSSGDWDLAKSSFENCLRIDPTNYRSMQGIATVYLRLGKRDQASAWMDKQAVQRRKSEEDSPPSEVDERSGIARHLALAASVYFKHGDVQEGLAVLNYSIACCPSSADNRLMLAEAYYRLGRTNDALLQLNETVRLQPKNRACWLQLFELYAQQRNWPIASHTLDQALKQLPNEPDLWAALVRMKIVANTGGSLSVVDACQTLIRLRGNAADHALYSQVLFNEGDREKSIAELKRAISLDPSNSSYATILNQITRQ